MKTSVPFSRVVLALLFLAIGYFPFGLATLSGILSYLSGGGPMDNMWDSEIYVWGLILSVFQLLAIAAAVTLFRVRKIFAVSTILIALFGISLYVFSYTPDLLKQQSKATDGHLHLLQFWLDGGGWFAVFIVGPLLIWYGYLRFRENKKVNSTSQP